MNFWYKYHVLLLCLQVKSDSSKLVIFQNLITVVGFSQAWIHSTPIVISGKVGKDPPRYIGQNLILIHCAQFLQIPFGSMAQLHFSSSRNNWLMFGIISYFAGTYHLSLTRLLMELSSKRVSLLLNLARGSFMSSCWRNWLYNSL